jgi:putative membrane protein
MECGEELIAASADLQTHPPANLKINTPSVRRLIDTGVVTGFLITCIANSLAIYAVAYLMSGVNVGSFRDAIIAGVVLSIINAIVKPIVVILTLPVTIVTLGLFYFFVTAFCLWLASVFVPGFIVQGLFTTIVAAILISLLSAFIGSILKKASE